MIVCFDTEFIEDGRTIDLISIGLVREDGLQLISRKCRTRSVARIALGSRYQNVFSASVTGVRTARAEIGQGKSRCLVPALIPSSGPITRTDDLGRALPALRAVNDGTSEGLGQCSVAILRQITADTMTPPIAA